MREFSTPMMQQYMNIKQQYPDCLLFFRLGDFYELFLDDAIVGAKALEIVLTRRPRGKDGDIPMAGVPFHAADGYIAKLVKMGHKVAICEQVSDPSLKGIVQRDVVRIVTPGSILDEKTLRAKEHNYTMSITKNESTIAFAVADVSTGDFQVTEIPYSENFTHILNNELARFMPSECILNSELYNDAELLGLLTSTKNSNVYHFPEWDTHAEQAETKLKKHFSIKTLRSFGLHDKPMAVRVAGALLGYLSHTQKDNIGHINTLKTYSPDEHVVLDASTISNLELFSTIRDNEEIGSFVHCIDETRTAMGGRLLRRWIREPLRNKKHIEARLNAVECVLHERSLREKVRLELARMYDIERIVSRLSVGIGTPHDLINLKSTLFSASQVYELLNSISSPSSFIQDKLKTIPEIIHVANYIDERLVPEPPIESREGGLMKSGVNPELDALRDSIRDSQVWIANLEQRERERSGIGSLKVRFNSVFGYYIEISKSNTHLVPSDYIRKQTTVNAERYITHELQTYEDKVLHGEDLINKKEYALFLEMLYFILSHTKRIQEVAHAVAELDCIISFATTAEHERYVKPEITSSGNPDSPSELKIEDGRHPVVEQLRDTSFVPNNTNLNNQDHQLLMLTGPNMAGKSVYMRQVALITLMAHMGSFVPAKRASISLVDRIFVRSGAADSIGRGLSTFMVEMVETAYILHHATQDSLIIMDEIGRGTSTYDGISIAWAVAEYLVTQNNKSAKTLFATHYHELQQLESHYPEKIKNYHMAIEESNSNPVFLYRLTRGGAHGSYAIAVAKLAGIPQNVTSRATELLKTFDETNQDSIVIKKLT